jgi:hypothetical protein
MKNWIASLIVIFICLMCSFVDDEYSNTPPDIRKLLTNNSLKYWDNKGNGYGWLFYNNHKFDFFEYDNNNQKSIVTQIDDIMISYQSWYLQNDTLIAGESTFKIKKITIDTLIVKNLYGGRDILFVASKK